MRRLLRAIVVHGAQTMERPPCRVGRKAFWGLGTLQLAQVR